MTDVWKTSSYTGAQGNCVEVASNTPQIRVRDTKDRGGPEISYDRAAWCDFISSIKNSLPAVR